nr:MAG TPA: hypothetical protein [Caudoviricetes sp.]
MILNCYLFSDNSLYLRFLFLAILFFFFLIFYN